MRRPAGAVRPFGDRHPDGERAASSVLGSQRAGTFLGSLSAHDKSARSQDGNGTRVGSGVQLFAAPGDWARAGKWIGAAAGQQHGPIRAQGIDDRVLRSRLVGANTSERLPLKL